METITNQQMQTPTPKSKTWPWIVIIILVAGLTAVGVYYWQNMEAKKLVKANEDKIRTEMQIKITEAENEATNLQKKLDEQIATNNYDNWQIYTNPTLGYSIKYPTSYKIDAEHSTDNAIFWRNESGENIMSIKYRAETVNGTLDTWFDNPKLDAIKLANIDGFKYQFKYCDGPSCGPETIAFVIPYQEKLLGLEFMGDYQYNSLEEKILSTFSLPNICQLAPIPGAIGYAIYPIDEKYKNFGHLGELFTAADCNNPERLSKIFGVNGENYNIGANISLKNNPSTEMLTTMKTIGFQCKEKITEINCKQWELKNTVKLNDFLKLKNFYQEITSSDCINCG